VFLPPCLASVRPEHHAHVTNPGARPVSADDATRTLVVEDDVRTADLIALYLRHAGHRVVIVTNGAEALGRLARERWDLVILDRMLPGADGLEVCRAAARAQGTAVIFVSALTLEEDRLAGFEAGGDDYITKPFSPRELVARVGAVLRRHPGATRTRSTVAGPLELMRDDRRALLNAAPLDLTPSEFEVLQALAERAGRGVARAVLLQRLPRQDPDTMPRTIDVHVRNLRRKLEEASPVPVVHIETVPGIGYRLTVA
jgi:DNA-binding response OmpR family regulator